MNRHNLLIVITRLSSPHQALYSWSPVVTVHCHYTTQTLLLSPYQGPAVVRDSGPGDTEMFLFVLLRYVHTRYVVDM